VSDDDNTVAHTSNAFNHGTHVAGCAGAVSDNNTGIASIGYNISLIAVKCVPNSQSNVNLLPNGYEGIAYAASAGADIINCSWSGGGFSQTAENVVEDAIDKGSLIVGAASNDGLNQTRYPAAFAGVIAVASTESNDTKSGFSNYGSWVDVCAPGASINSTLSPNTYGVQSGTSMAAPIVAGLLGLMKSLNPNLTNAQLEQCLLDNTDDISALNAAYAGRIGRGRINAQKAMQCVAQTLAAAPDARISSDVNIVCPNNPVQYYAGSAKGTATAYKWYFQGGTPSTSTLPNPVVTYAAKGKYDVTLVLTNSSGKDSLTINDYMEAAAQGRQVVFIRNFESGSLIDNGFTIENPDNSKTWEIINAVGNNGSTKSARMGFYNYPAIGERDALVTPVIDLSTNAEALLEMRHAYRRQNNNGEDSLIIYVSTDGGATFPHRVAAFSESGSNTFATNSNIATSFNPTTPNDWCYQTLSGASCIAVDLNDFYGESNVRIKLEAYNGSGNNLYIDDIKITANCAAYNDKKPKSAFKSDNTAFCGQKKVQFTNSTEYFPTSYQWVFEGGTPAASTDRHPEVTYTTAGEWDITLITGNGFGYDTLVINDYIVSLPAPIITVNAAKTTLCKGETIAITADGAVSYTWGPTFGFVSVDEDSLVVNPPTSITYNVTGKGANGCESTTSVYIKVLPLPGPVAISRVGDSLYATNANPGWTVQWLHNGLPINGAETVQHKPSLQGNYALKVTDSLGCSSTSGNYLYMPFGINTPAEERIIVYPNPASEVLYVVNETPFHDLTARVINSIGQVVAETQLTGNLSPVDISSLAPGIYYIKISNPKGDVTKKIIVNRQ
ncbi:MAG TPA: S8 family serine peptidase, partial [Bacteroidia bacterium]|nr:S8 family serine peptidase [Bacteroidia bacterium]